MRETFLKNDLLQLDIEVFEGDVFIHFVINKWSKSLFKYCLGLWVDIQDYFKEHGFNMLYVLIPDDDKKLLKFTMMFGFEIIAHCERNDIYLMCQDI